MNARKILLPIELSKEHSWKVFSFIEGYVQLLQPPQKNATKGA